jgi:hypothetical protein
MLVRFNLKREFLQNQFAFRYIKKLAYNINVVTFSGLFVKLQSHEKGPNLKIFFIKKAPRVETRPGSNVMIFIITLAFCAQNTKCYVGSSLKNCQSGNFFGENCQKSPKIGITTLTTGPKISGPT